jgi:hypothetical protein
MRNPDVAPHAAAFDALLERTPDGGVVDYDLPQPRWWWLESDSAKPNQIQGLRDG